MKYEVFTKYENGIIILGAFDSEHKAKTFAVECMRSSREKYYIRIAGSPYYKPAI